MATTPKILTYEEWLTLPEVEGVEEVVNGEIRKMPPAKVIHALSTRVPDIAVFIRGNVVEKDGYIHSAPELVVEVLSPANMRSERAEKLQDYESLGVPEVWVVLPEAQTVEVLLGHLKPTGFPEAVVDIASLWPKCLNLAQIKSAECGEAPGAVNQLLIADR
jgi:Uma2 family endonuclease